MNYSMKAQIERLKDSLFSDGAKSNLDAFSRCWHMILMHFSNKEELAKNWFVTENYMIGNVQPMKLVRDGKAADLERFIKACLDEY